jgi:AraC-like DNA-binding protein
VEKQIFSSSSLDEGQSEKAKFSQWQEIHNDQIWSVDYTLGNLPFFADIEATPLGPIVIGQMAGTIKQANRQRHHIAADGRDAYLLLINKGENALAGMQAGREYTISRGQGALVAAAEPLKMIGADRNLWSNIVIPQEVITSAFAHVNDRLAYGIDANNEALMLLSKYCHILESGPPLVSSAVITHVSETILDLVGLATGAKGEQAELAGLRGLKAARLQAILSRIRADFSNPHISARSIAQDLGISERYVQDVLEQSGQSLTTRVLEHRLQKARQMLSNPAFHRLQISEIAFASGFGDISYFNRAFRRRFGMTPKSAR